MLRSVMKQGVARTGQAGSLVLVVAAAALVLSVGYAIHQFVHLGVSYGRLILI
jgi:hypothetical protein